MMQGTFSERLRRFGARWSTCQNETGRELQHRLDELELRFGEYDHRVKNNTQMILSMLVAAAHSTTNMEARAVLDAVTRKLEAMMHVQTLLRQANHRGTLQCDEFIRELTQRIRDASPRQFVLILDCERTELPSSAAVPLGLIVNELLTNAIKHGIAAHEGRVLVRLRSFGDGLELRVDDNGPGIDVNAAPHASSGLTMVRHLASQLHGQFQTRPGPGGKCVLRFRRPVREA